MRNIIVFVVLLILSGCLYKTDDGLSFFRPYYMDRDRPVTGEDIKILDGALVLLSNEIQWNHDDDRLCFYKERWSLFCALARASIDVTGKYKHRRVALQETRFTINDRYHDRWKIHQLMDFNNHKDTKFDEVKQVLIETKIRLEKRLIPK